MKSEINSAAKAKINRAVYLLFLVTVMSVVNIYLIINTGNYYIFSLYFTNACSVLASDVSGAQMIAYIVVALLIALWYSVMAFFARKKSGWMICAVVFFSIDTALLVGNSILSMLDGNFNPIVLIDFVIHCFLVFCLILALKVFKEMKKQKQDNKSAVQSQEQPENYETAVPKYVEILRSASNEDATQNRNENHSKTQNVNKQSIDGAFATTTQNVSQPLSQTTRPSSQAYVQPPSNVSDIDAIRRYVIVERPRATYGAFAIFKCFIDNELVFSIANGETQEVEIDADMHVFSVLASETTGKRSYFDIPRGSADKKLRLKYSPGTKGAPKIADVTNEEE